MLFFGEKEKECMYFVEKNCEARQVAVDSEKAERIEK